MSITKLKVILLSSVLTFSATPYAFPQTTPKDSGAATTKMQKEVTSGQNEIKKAQQALKDNGMYPGAVDGTMNAEFEKSVRDYQEANKLKATGKLDHATMMKLGMPGVHHEGKSIETKKKGEKPHSRYHSSQKVKAVQAALEEKGFNPGPIDGRMGPKTTKALASFEGGPSATETERAEPAEADVSDRLANATEVIQDLTRAADRKIPDDLLARAHAIAVIPHVVKGAFGIGGRYGKGVVVQRLANGRWSAPAFISIGGGSFGLQIGVSATDLVLVFTDRNAVDTIAKGTSLKLGADAAVVAGPLGRTAEAGVTQDLKSAVYSYSRSKGLFAGVALDGAVLDIDKSDNRDVYGTTDVRTILSSDAMAKNAGVRNFVATLDRLIPAAKPTR